MTNFAIPFNLDTSLELDPKLLTQKSGKLLIDVTGEIELMVNNLRFFWEPSFTLLELGIHLRQWRAMNPHANKDFRFFSFQELK